jgi:uncharacterized protein (DUF58 family)
LPPLLVAAERVANTVAQGVHGRRRVGTGESFWQFRQFQPGDTRSAIDWRRSARGQHLYVREREWEAAQSIWLWCDSSLSMRYRSALAPSSKAERAALLLLALAALLVRGGERVALFGAEDPPAGSAAALHRLAATLLTQGGAAVTQRTNVPPLAALPRHAQTVWIGDWLCPREEIAAAMRRTAAAGVGGHLLQVLDPAEEEFPFTGRTEFVDRETGERLIAGRAEALRAAFRARLEEQQAALRTLCRSLGWSFAVHRTDRPPHTALLALYRQLSDAPGTARTGPVR